MANYIVNPITGINVPVVGVDPGEDYAYNISNALNTLSELTHTGEANQDGYQIPSAGLNIDGDVSWQDNNITDLRSTQFASQTTTLSGVGDLNCVYVTDGNLYFNNADGYAVQITAGEVVDSTAPSNFTPAVTSINLTIPSTADYNIVDVHSDAGAITITLPQVSSVPKGRFFYVKDIDGYAWFNNITIRTNGSDNMDGSLSAVLTTGYQAVMFVGNAISSWRIYAFDKSSYWTTDVLSFNAGASLQINSTASINIEDGGGIDLKSGGVLTSDYGSGIDISGNIQLVQNGASGPDFLIGNACTVSVEDGGVIDTLAGGFIKVENDANLAIEAGGTLLFEVGGLLNGTAQVDLTVGADSAIAFANPLLYGEMTFETAATINLTGTTTLNMQDTSVLNLASGATIANLGSTVNSSWPTWTTPAFRTLIQPVVLGGHSISGTFTILLQGASDNGTGGQWAVTLDRMQNGGTLSSIVLSWNVGASHTDVPVSLPNLSVARYKFGTPFSYNLLSTEDPQYFPTPGSGSDYYDSGSNQYLTYSTNQYHVIDNTQYYYVVVITDESGTNSLPTNNFYSLQLNYTNIPDQSWNM